MSESEGQLASLTAESLCMEYMVPQDTIDHWQKFDELIEGKQKRPGFEWVPLFKNGQQSVKVHLEMEGPSATKMTVMEGTKIVDRGTGLKFVEKNSRFFFRKPEIDLKPGTWAIVPHHGVKLYAKSIVWHI